MKENIPWKFTSHFPVLLKGYMYKIMKLETEKKTELDVRCVCKICIQIKNLNRI